ncbi:MAG: aspartate/tyrosine/aromatic aminotransferase [Pseudomonadales bacterium]|nr:aspartate/tyrosine/aromatic aminotransferase [Pseudomonadales bacterium]NRA18411.1 aspartate/tyrosine/aromatic aminotransferase [Oceanospirillaceae bacterium]
MFNQLQGVAPDALLKLIVQYNQDQSTSKVDLGVGVYKDEKGNTPVMQAVTAAEHIILDNQQTKSYIGPAGSALYCELSTQLLFGKNHPVIKDRRLSVAQTPGGCGALRMAAEFINICSPGATIWVSTPTWVNHIPLLGEAGLQLKEYPYYNYETQSVDFAQMLQTLDSASEGDLVLLHGCCHNPSGADLSREQWQQVIALVLAKNLIPFIDIAYQGLGDGLEEDAYGLRMMAEAVPEMIVASSCSKNFGLYRERTGTIVIISANAERAAISSSQLFSIIRGHYSMPPAHGAAIVETILDSSALHGQWINELDVMRARLTDNRTALVASIKAAGAGRNFDFISAEKGMFSFLGINESQVNRLRDEYSIYMAGSSRINIAGIATHNVDYVARAIVEVL